MNEKSFHKEENYTRKLNSTSGVNELIYKFTPIYEGNIRNQNLIKRKRIESQCILLISKI